MNIRRALEVLRKDRGFGQKFTWKEKEIEKSLSEIVEREIDSEEIEE